MTVPNRASSYHRLVTLDVLLVPPLPWERWVSIERYVEAIVSAAGDGASVRVASPPFAPGPGAIRRYRARYREYPAALREARFVADIVHIPDQALAHLVDAVAGQPLVVTCHDLMPLFLEESNHRSRFTTWVDLTLLRHSLDCMRTASRIVAVSETTKREVVRLLDVDPARIAVVPNMLDPAYQAPAEPATAHHRLPLRPRVLSVGRAAPYKNVESVIQALALPGLVEVSLVRVGEPLTAEQRELAGRLGVLSRTTELGHLEPAELAAVYAACDLLVQPSLYEGFGVPVIEAMACGLPVVCSDGGALEEVAGDASLAVPLASDNFAEALAGAIERILCEPDTASLLRAKGLSHADTFRPAAVFPRLLAAYRTAIKEHAS